MGPPYMAAEIDSHASYNFQKLFPSSYLELTRYKAETFQGIRLHIFVHTLVHKIQQTVFRTSLAP